MNLIKAKQQLCRGEYTCVACKGELMYASRKRGVAPLIEWVDKLGVLEGFSAADKVVGKGAAVLYVVLKVQEVYAQVISSQALSMLEAHGVKVSYELMVPFIQNRQGTGRCPVETAVWDIDVIDEAVAVIRQVVKELNGGIK